MSVVPVLGDFADLARGYAARFPARYSLRLRLEELTLDVRSNSEAVADDLRGYFGSFVAADASGPADLEFLLLEAPEQEPPVPLAVKPHAPGKRADKERFADVPGVGPGVVPGDLPNIVPDNLPGNVPGDGEDPGGGRVVRKQATGMLFLFGGAFNIAVGPCAANRNQLVNFLCVRYMERRLAQGWMLGHAAGVARPGQKGKGLALCGFAGMGKSTLALHLVARGLDFVSNDRVLVQPASLALGDVAQGRFLGPLLHGIPKHPRLNPGTALGNPALAGLLAPALEQALPEAARSAYARLAPGALRAVEDKYDAPIDACFGSGRFRLAAPLSGVVVLNWTHGGGALSARRVDLRQRPDLLKALRKQPGVFYLPQAIAGRARLTPEQCLEALAGVPALELCGGSDFEAAALLCEEFLGD
ncbi:MAG: HprK-related kinase B [Humidesulfovibrio sp.]|nr:HprK-related kinase B [Humidesulfovibrio sp.]